MKALHVIYLLIGLLVVSGIPTGAQDAANPVETQVVDLKIEVSNPRIRLAQPNDKLVVLLDFVATVTSPEKATITAFSVNVALGAAKSTEVKGQRYITRDITGGTSLRDFGLPTETQLEAKDAEFFNVRDTTCQWVRDRQSAEWDWGVLRDQAGNRVYDENGQEVHPIGAAYFFFVAVDIHFEGLADFGLSNFSQNGGFMMPVDITQLGC